jgi:hypothetical protein
LQSLHPQSAASAGRIQHSGHHQPCNTYHAYISLNYTQLASLSTPTGASWYRLMYNPSEYM